MKRKTRLTRHSLKIYLEKIKLIFLILLVLFILGFIYWFIFLSDFFQISKIEINGLIDDSKIESKIDSKITTSVLNQVEGYLKEKNQKFVPPFLYKVFPKFEKNQKNILLLSSGYLEKSIPEKNLEIEKIEVKLDIKNNILLLNLRNRKISFLACPKDNLCYFLDKSGVAFSKAPEISGALIRKIVISDAKTITLGEKILSPQILNKLYNIFLINEEKNSLFIINHLEIKKENYSELKLLTADKWHLKLNLDDNFNGVIETVRALAESELKSKMKGLEYIDCRYLPKIYYRLKGS